MRDTQWFASWPHHHLRCMTYRQLFLPSFLKTVFTIYFVYFHSNYENYLKWSHLRVNYCLRKIQCCFFMNRFVSINYRIWAKRLSEQLNEKKLLPSFTNESVFLIDSVKWIIQMIQVLTYYSLFATYWCTWVTSRATIFHLIILYTVHSYLVDVPEPPILTPTDLQEVMEETTVNLSCSAEAPCPKQPPTISWSNISESAHITTQLQEKPDKTQSVFSYITFKASYRDHRKNITCTATYTRNTPDASTESTMTLKVLCKNLSYFALSQA